MNHLEARPTVHRGHVMSQLTTDSRVVDIFGLVHRWAYPAMHYNYTLCGLDMFATAFGFSTTGAGTTPTCLWCAVDALRAAT